MNYKDIKEMRNDMTKITSRGFGYYIKNVGAILLLIVAVFIISNFTSMRNPKEFFESFDISYLWIVLILFLSIGGFYRIAVSINNDSYRRIGRKQFEEYTSFFDNRDKEYMEQHASLVQERFKNGPLITNELKDLLIKLDADRAAIIEMHNGTNNLSGFPFIYGDMAYETISAKVDYATDEFKNFNLVKLPFVALHYNDNSWIGSVSEIEKEDAYFAAKLRKVGVNYGAIISLEGSNGPLGFLTLFYKDENEHPSKTKIISEVSHTSQVVSCLLDKPRQIIEREREMHEEELD